MKRLFIYLSFFLLLFSSLNATAFTMKELREQERQYALGDFKKVHHYRKNLHQHLKHRRAKKVIHKFTPQPYQNTLTTFEKSLKDVKIKTIANKSTQTLTNTNFNERYKEYFKIEPKESILPTEVITPSETKVENIITPSTVIESGETTHIETKVTTSLENKIENTIKPQEIIPAEITKPKEEILTAITKSHNIIDEATQEIEPITKTEIRTLPPTQMIENIEPQTRELPFSPWSRR